MRLALISSALLALLSGCSIFGGEEAVRATTADGRPVWEAAGIDDYVMVQRSICFCYGPAEARITVRDGAIVAAVEAKTGRALTADEQRRFATIGEIFARIETASRREFARISATYDAQYGYPVNVDADPDPGIADEEFGYEISSFRPL